MAMCCEPALLIADEPTTNLDSTTQRGILDLLKELLADGRRALLFISHDLSTVAEMAQGVIVLQQGREVERGPTTRVLKYPAQPYTRRLLASRPPRDRFLRRLPVDEESPDLEALTLLPQALERRLSELQRQPPLLRVENLQTWFPLRKGWWGKPQWLRAVDGVSFELFPGERLGLLGESGSGKTTLGRTLLRLLTPRSGRILFEGRNLTALEGEPLRRLRPHLQVVFQNPYAALNPRHTVGETLMEPLKVHRLAPGPEERRARALEMLHAVGLGEEHFHRLPRQLSGGQRQRVAIARALMTRPRLLICDECVSSLDVSVQAQVLNLLLDLQERFGLALLFISHDLAVVRLMSDRVLVMEGGKIVEAGPVTEVFENPRHPYTRQLLTAGA
ncbi:MAG: ABC transporter ATP-binding protein [Bacteroidetes bacterium]|nr:MAG: ABC transporter ATP-binding protein [Bacteroidota bacterium]